MEGLTIRKKVMPQASSSPASFANTAIGLLIFAAVLIALPFLLATLLFVILRDKLNPPKPAAPVEPRSVVWHEVPNNYFLLRYQYVLEEEIPGSTTDYFSDDEPLILYKAGPEITFFDGYFANFKIERPGGIFAQKVNFNTELTEIVSMPLYFFNYATREAEEIHDFKDYDLNTRGGPNSFKIIASNLEDGGENLEVEININSAIR